MNYALLAIVPAIILLLPILGIGPRQKQGRALNNMWGIVMPDPSLVYPGRWGAVRAQEVVEYWCAWFIALVLSFPVALLAAIYLVPPVVPLVYFIAAMACYPVRGTKMVGARLELLGHGAEWLTGRRHRMTHLTQKSYFTDLDVFAGQTHAGYQKGDHAFFDKWSVADVKQGLIGYMGLAKFLVGILGASIRKGLPQT